MITECINNEKLNIRLIYSKGRGDILKSNIIDAYKDLKQVSQSVEQIVYMLVGIKDGVYTVDECILAGLILTRGIDGMFVDSKSNYSCKAKYIRINDYGYIFYENHMVLGQGEINNGAVFYGNNGTKIFFNKEQKC